MEYRSTAVNRPCHHLVLMGATDAPVMDMERALAAHSQDQAPIRRKQNAFQRSISSCHVQLGAHAGDSLET